MGKRLHQHNAEEEKTHCRRGVGTVGHQRPRRRGNRSQGRGARKAGRPSFLCQKCAGHWQQQTQKGQTGNVKTGQSRAAARAGACPRGSGGRSTRGGAGARTGKKGQKAVPLQKAQKETEEKEMDHSDHDRFVCEHGSALLPPDHDTDRWKSI